MALRRRTHSGRERGDAAHLQISQRGSGDQGQAFRRERERWGRWEHRHGPTRLRPAGRTTWKLHAVGKSATSGHRPPSRAPAPPARPGSRDAPRPHPANPAPTFGPLSSGDDVFPELPHCPVPGHLLVPRQPLRQLDFGRELYSRTHGDRAETPRYQLPRRYAWARCVTSHARAGLGVIQCDVTLSRQPLQHSE